MTRQTRFGALVALPVTILMATAAMAQSPDGAPAGDNTAATPGAVDTSTTTTTTTTADTYNGPTTETSDVALDAPAMDDTSALPNTGGEPLMLAMLGSLAAMGAFGLRRKLG